jgi:hypothetical protein
MDSGKLIEILNTYNKFWSLIPLDTGVRRDVLERCLRQVDSKEILVIKGVRRSGKSTLMAQIIKALLEKGVKPTQVLRVNLEEPLFSPEASIDLLERIYRTYRERINPRGRCFLFLDEIQNVEEWERWVRGRSDTEDVKIILTGSSSSLLSREAGTKLTGRHVSFEVFPLSFPEFLRFNGMEVRSEQNYYGQKTSIRNLFDLYLKYGGFPEVVLKKSTEDKELLLKQYFEDIIYRDIVARHEIRDVTTLMNLAVFLLTNVSNLISVHRLKRNFDISQDKAENYGSAMLESYLLFRLHKFTHSMKKSQRAGFKIYAVDTGLRNRVAFSFSEDMSRLVENLVYVHLRQQNDDVYYEANGGEIDFVIKEGIKVTRRIQVWYDDPSVHSIPVRERAAFRESKADNLLVTNDIEDVVSEGRSKIRLVPITRFLLDL